MNNIVLPMKVHAVKLEYRRIKLKEMIQGHFKTVNNRKIVVITREPGRPQVSSRHPRRLNADSAIGKTYAEEVSKYLLVKSEYDSLLFSWNSRYNIAPPKVRFPIRQFADPHLMNNEYFAKQAGHCGKYQPDNPTVSDHGDLKSKNELIGAGLLKYLGIPFKYETEIYLKEIDETINPDYLVDFYEIDRCSYLEILGMNDKSNYSVTTATKINGFSRDKYRPGREVIYIVLYDKQNFDRDYFVSQVLSAFNDMIPDEALIWKTESVAV